MKLVFFVWSVKNLSNLLEIKVIRKDKTVIILWGCALNKSLTEVSCLFLCC